MNNVQVNKVCKRVAKFLNSKVSLSRSSLKQLSPHKNTLRKLASKKTSMKTKRHLLQKGGGFLILKALKWHNKKKMEMEEAERQRQLNNMK
jgi:hypothetical protein